MKISEADVRVYPAAFPLPVHPLALSLSCFATSELFNSNWCFLQINPILQIFQALLQEQLKCSEPQRPESEAGFDATSHSNMFFWEMKSESFWTTRYNFHESTGMGINYFTFLGCNFKQARPRRLVLPPFITSPGTFIISNYIYHVILCSQFFVLLWPLNSQTRDKRIVISEFFLN